MRVEPLLNRIIEAGRKAGFEVRIFARIKDYELPVLTRRGRDPDSARRVYVSAGGHGDEPAGPMALLETLRRNAFDPDVDWTLVPVVNPTGLASGTRHNAEDIDLNRDYGAQPRSDEIRAHLDWLGKRRFDLAVCQHEDYETGGAYIYELKAPGAASHAPAVLDAMRPWTGIETRPEIDEMPNENGLMRPPIENFAPDRKDLPEAIRIHFHHATRCYTIETPSARNIVERIGAQRAALETLARLAREGAFDGEALDSTTGALETG